MTFKELLNSVQFEDVAHHIVRMYPDMENSIGWYKIHFDMLRLMNPVYHEDANDKVCNITIGQGTVPCPRCIIPFIILITTSVDPILILHPPIEG